MTTQAKTAQNSAVPSGTIAEQDNLEISAQVDSSRVAAEAADRARREEKERQRKELERLQKERDDFAARLKEKEEAERQAQLAAMQPDARVQAQLQDLQNQMLERDKAAAKKIRALEQHSRAMELTGYREMVLRKYGDEIIPDVVVGNSEEEIDQSAEAAHQAYVGIYAKARQQVQASLPQEMQPQMIPVPVVQAPPPNPAYVHQPYAQQAYFPTAVNAEPVASADPGQVDLKDLTSEEAVRSGRYSGEQRAQLMNQMKRMSGVQNLGSSPRYYGQQPSAPMHVQMPNGVMQPQGTPMGPAMNPQMYAMPQAPSQPQQPMAMPIPAVQGPMQQQQFNQAAQYAPVQHPQGQTPGDAARAAVARTHAGQTQMAGTLGPALAQTHEYAAKNGVNANTAFAQRFNNTPPVGNA